MGPPQLSNAVRWQIIGMREACMSLRQIAFGAFIFIMSTYFKSPDVYCIGKIRNTWTRTMMIMTYNSMNMMRTKKKIMKPLARKKEYQTNVNAPNISQNQSRHQKKHHQKNASQYLYYQFTRNAGAETISLEYYCQLRFTPAFLGLNHLDRQLLYLVRI